MLLHLFIPLLACLGLATAREVSRVFKSLPAISNSLVNLGKMDVSFYFNSKTPGKDAPSALSKSDFVVHQPNSLFTKLDTIAEEPCPCMRNSKNSPQTNPSAILNNLLMSNDLFSFNKNEPTSSMACCDSNERVQEETIFFELGPKHSHMDLTQQIPSQQNNFPMLPFIFDSIMQKQPLPSLPMKPKAVEIFFFPKKKDSEAVKFFPNKKEFKKNEIQVVGDKDLRNDFKSYKYRPSFPISSFGKKFYSTPDTVKETKPVKEVKFDETTEKTTQTTVSQPNIVMN